MKRIFFICIVVNILASSSAFCQGYGGLIARWSFNGNANDISGNGLNGVVHNANLTIGSTGIANTAYQFNGTNSYIFVPYDSIMNTAKHTICAVVKPSGYYLGHCHGNSILWRGNELSPSFSYHLEYNNNAYDSNNCSLYDPSHELFMGGTGPGFSVTYVSQWNYPNFIDTGIWYCVVAAFENDTEKIYVDGILKLSVHESGSLITSTNGIRIGMSENDSVSFPYWLNGAIDEIRAKF